MRKLSKEQQLKILCENIISRYRTLGNRLFTLTPDNLIHLTRLQRQYNTGIMYSAFYDYSEENKSARDADIFLSNFNYWLHPKKVKKPPVEVFKPDWLPADEATELFRQIKARIASGMTLNQ